MPGPLGIIKDNSRSEARIKYAPITDKAFNIYAEKILGLQLQEQNDNTQLYNYITSLDLSDEEQRQLETVGIEDYELLCQVLQNKKELNELKRVIGLKKGSRVSEHAKAVESLVNLYQSYGFEVNEETRGSFSEMGTEELNAMMQSFMTEQHRQNLVEEILETRQIPRERLEQLEISDLQDILFKTIDDKNKPAFVENLILKRQELGFKTNQEEKDWLQGKNNGELIDLKLELIEAKQKQIFDRKIKEFISFNEIFTFQIIGTREQSNNFFKKSTNDSHSPGCCYSLINTNQVIKISSIELRAKSFKNTVKIHLADNNIIILLKTNNQKQNYDHEENIKHIEDRYKNYSDQISSKKVLLFTESELHSHHINNIHDLIKYKDEYEETPKKYDILSIELENEKNQLIQQYQEIVSLENKIAQLKNQLDYNHVETEVMANDGNNVPPSPQDLEIEGLRQILSEKDRTALETQCNILNNIIKAKKEETPGDAKLLEAEAKRRESLEAKRRESLKKDIALALEELNKLMRGANSAHIDISLDDTINGSDKSADELRKIAGELWDKIENIEVNTAAAVSAGEAKTSSSKTTFTFAAHSSPAMFARTLSTYEITSQYARDPDAFKELYEHIYNNGL